MWFVISFIFLGVLLIFLLLLRRLFKHMEKIIQEGVWVSRKQIHTETVRKLNESLYNLEIAAKTINNKFKGGN